METFRQARTSSLGFDKFGQNSIMDIQSIAIVRGQDIKRGLSRSNASPTDPSRLPKPHTLASVANVKWS